MQAVFIHPSLIELPPFFSYDPFLWNNNPPWGKFQRGWEGAQGALFWIITAMKFVSLLYLSFRYSVLIFVHQSPFHKLTKTLYVTKINWTRIRLNDLFMILNLFKFSYRCTWKLNPPLGNDCLRYEIPYYLKDLSHMSFLK